MEYTKITNPVNGKKVVITSKLGKNIINNYINELKEAYIKNKNKTIIDILFSFILCIVEDHTFLTKKDKNTTKSNIIHIKKKLSKKNMYLLIAILENIPVDPEFNVNSIQNLLDTCQGINIIRLKKIKEFLDNNNNKETSVILNSLNQYITFVLTKISKVGGQKGTKQTFNSQSRQKSYSISNSGSNQRSSKSSNQRSSKRSNSGSYSGSNQRSNPGSNPRSNTSRKILMGTGVLLAIATGISAGNINTNQDPRQKSVVLKQTSDVSQQLSVENSRFNSNTHLSQSRIATIGNVKQITDNHKRFKEIESVPIKEQQKIDIKDRALLRREKRLRKQQNKHGISHTKVFIPTQVVPGKKLKKNQTITLPSSSESFIVKKQLGEFSSEETGGEIIKPSLDGVVYKVINKYGKTFALKLSFKPDQYEDSKLREINLLVPESIKIYESGLLNGQPYILMDYIEGSSYEDYCKINDCNLMREKVCNCISKYHDVGILHRDLHEQNVLIDKTGNPRIIDFSRANLEYNQKKKSIPQKQRNTDTNEFQCWKKAGKGFKKNYTPI